MIEKTSERERLMLSMPPALKSWLEEQAQRHCTSMNAEAIRSIAERRERMQAKAGAA
jgi:hypothetical protein